MKLTYWVAECLNDSKAYNIRAKTKKECVRIRTLVVSSNNGDRYDTRFAEPKKVSVEYDSGFDLLTACLGECGAYWE